MGTKQLAPSDQVGLSFPLPDGAREREVTPVDLGAASGAELVLQEAWTLPDGGWAEVGCVTAAAHLWVPGLEGAVLAGASAMVRDRAGLSVLTPGAVEPVAGHFEQSFRGSGGSTEGGTVGRHVLGFVDDGQGVLLCTLVCAAPEPAASCEPMATELTVHGQLEPPPPPGVVAATLAFVAASPRTAATLAGLVLLLAALVIVVRRPRPAW